VEAGSFEYRTSTGRELMSAGALLLGNHGQTFECAHRHGEGDRCVAFWYAPDYFERLAAEAGVRAGHRRFKVARLPRLRQLSALAAQASAALRAPDAVPWEELAVTLASRTVTLAAGASPSSRALPPNVEARLMRAIRAIDATSSADLTLGALARHAGLSPYHFLRSFKAVLGVTPHQYLLRVRLRAAASQLVAGEGKVLDVALDSGFGDVSNFNRAFRAEFAMSPLAWRRAFTRT
jgi:AraC-like DNA-binding protein